MVISVSAAQADANARTIDVRGQAYVLRGYVGAAPVRGTYIEGNESNDNELPQGFLVDQPAGSTTHPHFHETNQFQVFVGGSARFGKKPAAPLTVQYASGHTPYGPIVAGDDGVQYFTLRQRWDPGAKYMPQMRDRLQRGRQRQALIADLPVLDAVELAQLKSSDTLVFLGPEADGLLGALVNVAPNMSVDLPDPAQGMGQYQIVVSGSMRHRPSDDSPSDESPIDDSPGDNRSGNNAADEQQLLGRLSCQFVFANDGAARAQAGDGGLQLLVLRFPTS